MSRVGRRAIVLPAGVTAMVAGQNVKVNGPKGELSFSCPEQLKIAHTAAGIELQPVDASKQARALWGMARTRVLNLVQGVTTGYSHTLEIHGVGFKAALKGKDALQLQVGFSHDVVHKIPPGVEVKVAGAKQELIEVSGIDKQKVGQMAAEIRASRPPEPYQGKGIRYRGEHIHRKEGKKK
jgi:large subunit ribosomal protein L6